MTRQYTRAAIFLNGNPFVMILFFRLCSFLLATAVDFQRFNITFSAIYSSLIVWIIALLMMKRRPDSAIRYKTILKWTSIYSGLCTIVINLLFIFTFVWFLMRCDCICSIIPGVFWYFATFSWSWSWWISEVGLFYQSYWAKQFEGCEYWNVFRVITHSCSCMHPPSSVLTP